MTDQYQQAVQVGAEALPGVDSPYCTRREAARRALDAQLAAGLVVLAEKEETTGVE